MITLGIDVGGTFTDLVLLERAAPGAAPSGAGGDPSGVGGDPEPAPARLRIAKVPTTVDNQAFGVMRALEAAEVDLAAAELIVHGTTTTTNALLERRLARTGLITTAGFRDVLELGRRTRPAAYGMVGTFEPIVPRDLRLEVDERTLADGTEHVPLDEAGVAAAVQRLLALGCEAVVVHFLHAYANPAHEARAAEIVRGLWPNAWVVAGHELLSESREFERGVTAAVSAAVRPPLERYLDTLVGALREAGYARELLIVNGNGGMASPATVVREAAKTVMSGPASGVMAAAYTGRAAGRTELITFDMGGTSTDVALVRGAEPAVSNEIEIEYGLPVHVPLVDVRTVGAGGGSIARVDAGGLLAVGPESAGATPGPIVYGRGGERPTITDANAILGRLDVAEVAGLDESATAALVGRARERFEAELGGPLGLDAEGAALAVVRVANALMAGAVRRVSVSLGVDPRDYALFAFGGAGPLHASALARELGIPTVLVPARPGLTNALGCLVADLRHDFVDTLAAPLGALDLGALHERIRARIAEGETILGEASVPLARIERRVAVDMQFVGQTHLLRVPLDGPEPSLQTLQSRFERAYFARFRVNLPEIRAALANVAVSVVGVRETVDLAGLIDPAGRADDLDGAREGTRAVRFDEGTVEAPVYRRERLPVDAAFEGPAIVAQSDTTLLVEPGDAVRGDAVGNLIVSVARG